MLFEPDRPSVVVPNYGKIATSSHQCFKWINCKFMSLYLHGCTAVTRHPTIWPIFLVRTCITGQRNSHWRAV